MEPDARSLQVLLIDDEPDILWTVGDYLKDLGYVMHTAKSAEAGLRILEAEPVDIIITDLHMPGLSGLELLDCATEVAPQAEAIVITGQGDMDAAIRAMRRGVHDFFAKPVRLEELTASIERTARFHAVRMEKERYEQRLRSEAEDSGLERSAQAIVGDSSGMRIVKEMIGSVSEAESTSVLVVGETGTGKELVAQAIHYASSRRTEPFVALNCTAIPDTLAESELFGHTKGAFTGASQMRRGRFEQADRGTLFLDEVGDMSLAMQARLLRVLEERTVQRVGDSRDIPVNVRVVSATNRDLEQAMDDEGFREDLFYRLNTFTIRIPPLRERREDIAPLARHFLQRYAGEMRKPVAGFTDAAEAQLLAHNYPGNIRELRNLVERAVILCRDELVDGMHLQFDATRATAGGDSQSFNLASLEHDAIRRALESCGGNQVQASRLLGISRDTLRRRMERHNIENPG